MEVRREFADFVNRYWFHEVSNQEQAKELFSWWSERLGNPGLLEKLGKEVAAADSILNGVDQHHRRKREEARQRDFKLQQVELQTLQRRTEWLTRFLFWLTGLAVAVGALDSELFRKAATLSGKWIRGARGDDFKLWWPLLVWSVIGIACFILVLYGFYRGHKRGEKDATEKERKRVDQG